jgi:hypothetical protein
MIIVVEMTCFVYNGDKKKVKEMHENDWLYVKPIN